MLSNISLVLAALGIFQSVTGNNLVVRRAIPAADVTECAEAAVWRSCRGAVQRGWNAGQFREFTTKRMFYWDRMTNCVITYFS